jgi:histidinol-phosphate aminotransferase
VNETTWAQRELEAPHLMVSWTSSKAYGLAVLRLGYLFCAQSLANFLNGVRNPWNVSLLAYHVALAALGDKIARMERRDLIIGAREWLIDQVNRLPSIHALDSEGKYVLIDASSLGCSSSALVASLIE